ncbi:MAG: hypothetical protein ACJZ8Y_01660 [Pirellulaceae bacterium]|jgi:biopolymer transport protein ExbB/TolQ|nr:hypothetical protein [Planctomycetaceae bacterium]MDB4864510.1 hypothetical protein [Pirellulaceae bacterium]|tara:strand:- start:20 stop:157 length:138 start_codon:yes stop_codon:yes gene_type:complete
MTEKEETKTDFIAPVVSKPNSLLLKTAIGLFVAWIGVLFWIISRS